jgi:hypothetical protein
MLLHCKPISYRFSYAADLFGSMPTLEEDECLLGDPMHELCLFSTSSVQNSIHLELFAEVFRWKIPFTIMPRFNYITHFLSLPMNFSSPNST